jgi:cellulose synthase/poly-beta-1,6-N-acetylglucosamine synthase-like glycosyltransferase
MMWQFIHFIDWMLWLFMAVSVGYVAFFALVSLLPKKKRQAKTNDESEPTDFLVIFPAYHEDTVICRSVEEFLKQDYPQAHWQLIVVSDHMRPETNQWLAEQPLTLLQPTFEKSSKAKALQFAIKEHDNWREGASNRKVVILDADNIVAPDFLTRLNAECHHIQGVVQCHRTAKNSDNDIAALDGTSEEINNTIFRRAHNQIGMSSALIGSGMCFDFEWFKAHVNNLSTAVEDRELEALIMRVNIYIHYAEDIYVYDEKVSSGDNFQRQRLRWMTGQLQALFRMLPYLPKAIVTGNIDYIDKTVQQALIPRSILLAMCFVLIVGGLAFSSVTFILLYLLTFLLLAIALFIAIPSQLRTKALIGKALALPALVWRMLSNILQISPKNKEFIHTTHKG